MIIHICMNLSYLNVNLNTGEPGGQGFSVADPLTPLQPGGHTHIAKSQSTFIPEHVKLNI